MDDRRSDLEAAFEAATPEAAVPEAPPDTVTPSPIATDPQTTLPGIGETEAQKTQRVRDEEGKFAKTPKEPKKDAAEGKEAAPKEEATTEKPVEKAPERPKLAPPKALGAAAREAWAKLPEDAQQAIVKRDRETALALNESAEARQFQQRFREEMAPFDPIFRANNVDSIQGSKWLAQQYTALTNGSAPQKVQIAVNMLQAAGLTSEEGIQLLAQALSGQQAPGQQAPPVYRDPRVDEIYSRLQQAEQARNQSMQQQAQSQIAEVEGEEFYDDVRDIMADLVEGAGRRGLLLTPREAYNRAILADPATSKVIEQRRMASTGASVQGSMKAASSVRSNPASAPAGADQRDDLRSAIEAAWGAQRR